jgi:hypothetical protein
LSEFQDFFYKSQRVDAVLTKLLLENDLHLNNERINEIRVQFDLDPLEMDLEGKAFPFEHDQVMKTDESIEQVDIKSELADMDMAVDEDEFLPELECYQGKNTKKKSSHKIKPGSKKLVEEKQPKKLLTTKIEEIPDRLIKIEELRISVKTEKNERQIETILQYDQVPFYTKLDN